MTPNELKKIKEFEKAIEGTFDNESAAIACMEIAKQLAIDFAFHIKSNNIPDGLEAHFKSWIK